MSTTTAAPQPSPPLTLTLSAFLSTIQSQLQHDSASTMGGLKQLDEVNGRVRDRYKALADGAGRLLGGEHVGAVYADIANYTKQIESTEEKVSNLELLVEELERLADELG